jgi:hypothetical protein
MASTSIDSSDRRVIIEVMGGHAEMARTGTHTITIPYRCFSQKLRSLQRHGGKIISVTMADFLPDSPDVSVIQAVQPLPVMAKVIPVEVPAAVSEVLVEAVLTEASEPIDETVVEAETPIPEILIPEISEKPEPKTPAIEAEIPASTPKSQKTKSSPKKGFNKPSGDTQTKRKPKS